MKHAVIKWECPQCYKRYTWKWHKHDAYPGPTWMTCPIGDVKFPGTLRRDGRTSKGRKRYVWEATK
jgi:hypothetical protein